MDHLLHQHLPVWAWHLHRQFIHARHPRLQRRLPKRLVQRIRLNHRSDRLILLKVHFLVRLALTSGYILSLPELHFRHRCIHHTITFSFSSRFIPSGTCSRTMTATFKERLEFNGYLWKNISQETKMFYFREFQVNNLFKIF